MDINDFRTFIEVSRTRHFGQAAQNLCITQSAVSARIKQLEDALGKSLFIRQRNNIQLTPAGEQMLFYAESITSAWNSARQNIGISTENRTSLVLGGMIGLWDITLQDWLHRVYSEFTNLTIQAQIHGIDVLHSRTLNGSIDLAFVYDPPVNDMITVKAISDIPLVLVSTQHGLDAERAVRENYVMVDWGVSYTNSHNRAYPDAPSAMLYTSHDRIALDFLFARGGNAYLAGPTVQPYVDEGRLHLVGDAPVFSRTAFAIYRTDNENAPIISKLVDTAIDVMTEQHSG